MKMEIIATKRQACVVAGTLSEVKEEYVDEILSDQKI